MSEPCSIGIIVDGKRLKEEMFVTLEARARAALVLKWACTSGKPTSMENPTVVIVDDDENFLEELSELLCTYGYAVSAVSDPLAAVGVIEKAQPVAVLLDLKMDAKDGFEIARELSEKPVTAGITVIAMTGHYTEEQMEKLRSSGVVKSFLIKPLSIPDIVEMLDGIRAPR